MIMVYCCFAGLTIIHSAEVVLSSASASSSSKRPDRTQWLPVLPAALAAWPAVLNHTQGVRKTAHMLLEEHEHHVQPQRGVAAFRRGRAQAAMATPAGSGSMGLLSLPCVNSFLCSAVSIARSAVDDGDVEMAEQAAAAALQVATALQTALVHVSVAASAARANRGSNSRAVGETIPTGSTADDKEQLCPDAITYSCLVQLYGIRGQSQQVADITMAAVTHQLVMMNSTSSNGIALQEVLAGSAAAWLSAGNSDVVFALLDGAVAAGVSHINHPRLIDRLLEASAVAIKAEEVSGVAFKHAYCVCHL